VPGTAYGRARHRESWCPAPAQRVPGTAFRHRYSRRLDAGHRPRYDLAAIPGLPPRFRLRKGGLYRYPG